MRSRKAAVAQLRATTEALVARELASPDRCAVVARVLDGIERGRPERRRLAILAERTRSALNSAYSRINLLTASGALDVTDEANPQPESDAFCRLTLTGNPVVVRDSLAVLFLADNPHRTQVRSYIGAPIVVAGEVVGTLCAYGPSPRSWTEAQEAALVVLAKEAAELIGA